ncbi:hypothetical protein ACFQOY_11825 [Enterococcus alcedinis]|uniref:hypothetical protein n=1 Tax=Enterococcus alcedinis TaxID=1274384 RepID=UPI0036146B23
MNSLKQLEQEKKIERILGQSNYWGLIGKPTVDVPDFIEAIDYYRYGKKKRKSGV